MFLPSRGDVLPEVWNVLAWLCDGQSGCRLMRFGRGTDPRSMGGPRVHVRCDGPGGLSRGPLWRCLVWRFG